MQPVDAYKNIAYTASLLRTYSILAMTFLQKRPQAPYSVVQYHTRTFPWYKTGYTNCPEVIARVEEWGKSWKTSKGDKQESDVKKLDDGAVCKDGCWATSGSMR